MQYSVRVIIVDYNGREVIPLCLSSLVKTIPESVPVTVINNASPIPSESCIPPELMKRLDIVRLPENIGYAGAIAKAWEITSEDYLVVANNDLEFTPGWLDSMLQTAVNKNAHSVSAIVVHEDETEIDKTTNASLNPLLFLIPGIFKDRSIAVFPSGACFLVKKDPAIPNPPVDPSYFLYYEDTYLGFLLRSIGLNIVQDLCAEVIHKGGHSVGKSSRARIAFLQERNRLLTMCLFFDTLTLFQIFPLIFFDSLFKPITCLLRQKPIIATLKAHWWILFNWPSIRSKRAQLRKLPGFDTSRIIPFLTGKVLPDNKPGAGFWNALSTGWCRLVGLLVDKEI